MEIPLVTFPAKLIMSHPSLGRGHIRTEQKVTKANLFKIITALTRKKQRLLGNTIDTNHAQE